MHSEALLLRRWLDICLPMGSSEFIPLLTSITRAAFIFLVKLSLSQFMSLLSFLLFSSYPMEEADE